MFITFEGPDGSGKTTQIALLADHLAKQGYSILRLREPGGTRIGEQIREVLHNHDHNEMHPHAEVLLYSAARAQIVAEVIRPALEAGKVVLCDRFFDSTFAYQGYGHQLDFEALKAITRFATGGLQPDLTIYIDLDPMEGLRRRQDDQTAEWNRLDALGEAFHRRVHEGYQQLIQEQPDRWLRVDGTQSIEAIQARVRELVAGRLPEKKP
jgi:dTMP kinase